MSSSETDSMASAAAEKPQVKSRPEAGEIPGLDPLSSIAPDGGLRAWLVAAGGGCIFFSALGFANAFGVFQEYLMTHQLRGESADNVAWIGSLAAFLQFVTGAVAGPLFDRFGEWVIRPAAVVYIFAIMMSSLCHAYWQFILAQGVLLGISAGFLQFPVMAAVSQWFDKKRGAALGLAVAGSSIGGVVIPIALSKMLNSTSLGFGWSVRIVGFLVTPLLIFACLAIKTRVPPRQSKFFIGAAFKEATYNLLIVALIFMFMGVFTPLFFIPTYAVTLGVDPTLASYMLAIVNAASTFGRIIPGILADKLGRRNGLAAGGIATGIVILCMTKVQTTAALIVYSVAVGFTSGTIISGGATALTVCAQDPRNIGTYTGMALAIGSISALIGPPVNGALVDNFGGFLQASIFSGVMCLAGGFTAFASKAYTPQGLWGKI